ncbi:hypothetical protein LAZ67_16001638 [Cordylochernes scorpioides]|uniref:Ig-like domain-containing protein n=1 Tax=Cordylochernes scorpioides TaxID=51811 RepID=A0ABY6LBE6_9ARAC|nr:hypothetical protein LAZ67_16001638 [Cordylochernes scorpioides]
MRCGAVPPTIVEEDTSSDVAVPERSKVSLRCRAEGYPPPTVTWRREEGKDINIATYASRSGSSGAKNKQKNTLKSSIYVRMRQLSLRSGSQPASRDSLGAQRCTWSAGWRPPAAPDVLGAGGRRPHPAEKHLQVLGDRHLHSSYRTNMTLRIAHVDESDFGPYKCVAKNTLGEKEGYVRLYGEDNRPARKDFLWFEITITQALRHDIPSRGEKHDTK